MKNFIIVLLLFTSTVSFAQNFGENNFGYLIVSNDLKTTGNAYHGWLKRNIIGVYIKNSNKYSYDQTRNYCKNNIAYGKSATIALSPGMYDVRIKYQVVAGAGGYMGEFDEFGDIEMLNVLIKKDYSTKVTPGGEVSIPLSTVTDSRDDEY